MRCSACVQVACLYQGMGLVSFACCNDEALRGRSDQQWTPVDPLPCPLDDLSQDSYHLFSQQIFIEHFLCAGHHRSPEDTNFNNSDSSPRVSTLPVSPPCICSPNPRYEVSLWSPICRGNTLSRKEVEEVARHHLVRKRQNQNLIEHSFPRPAVTASTRTIVISGKMRANAK